jgi:hypothetical protein
LGITLLPGVVDSEQYTILVKDYWAKIN